MKLSVFKEALKATAIHRGSLEKIIDVKGIIEQISSNGDLKSMWGKYQKKFAYASDILYENVMDILRALILENSLQGSVNEFVPLVTNGSFLVRIQI